MQQDQPQTTTETEEAPALAETEEAEGATTEGVPEVIDADTLHTNNQTTQKQSADVFSAANRNVDNLENLTPPPK